MYDSQVQSNHQRLIQSLEAMFEACAQLLIQLFFLAKIGIGQSDTSTNIIIIFSIIWSLISVVSKSTSEDKALILKNEGQEPLLKWKFPKFISWKWLLRAIFRFLDVSSRMCILLLICVLLGGFNVITVICIEFSVLTFIKGSGGYEILDEYILTKICHKTVNESLAMEILKRAVDHGLFKRMIEWYPGLFDSGNGNDSDINSNNININFGKRKKFFSHSNKNCDYNKLDNNVRRAIFDGMIDVMTDATQTEKDLIDNQ